MPSLALAPERSTATIERTAPSLADWLGRRLLSPVSIAPLAAFRIVFSLLLLRWSVWVYFDHGLIETRYVQPAFLFSYYGFEWVRPWAGIGMHLHFAALGLLAFCVGIGFSYRLSATLLFLGLAYVFLLDQALYSHQSYLICLVSFLMILIPAHRAVSIDGWLRPDVRSPTVPAWCLWALRLQLGLPYFFSGLTKVQADWLGGEPLRFWLRQRTDVPLIGRWLTEEWFVRLASWGALSFDLLILPALIWRRTRTLAIVVAVVFNLISSRWFDLGLLSWLMIAGAALFLPASWFELIMSRDRKLSSEFRLPPSTFRLRVVVAVLGIYTLLQVLVPLRYWLYPGTFIWTLEGLRFSWSMRTTERRGELSYVITDPASGESWRVDPADELSRTQLRKVELMPDLILQYAHHLADRYSVPGHQRVQVRAISSISVNCRPLQTFIDPEVDLAAQPRSLWPARWIAPFESNRFQDVVGDGGCHGCHGQRSAAESAVLPMG